MPKIPLPEDEAIAALLRLLKWNPRITIACAMEKTQMDGASLEALAKKHSHLLGTMHIRGYTFITTAAEKAASSRKEPLSTEKRKAPLLTPIKPATKNTVVKKKFTVKKSR